MNKDKVLSLAKLSRIDINDLEAETLSHEFEAILGYVDEIKNIERAEAATSLENFPLRNEFRTDETATTPGIYTEKILANAPDREGDYLKVKKIL